MAVYVGIPDAMPTKNIPRLLGLQLGLHTLDGHWLTDNDGISPLSVMGAEERSERRDFIPYTDKPIAGTPTATTTRSSTLSAA